MTFQGKLIFSSSCSVSITYMAQVLTLFELLNIELVFWKFKKKKTDGTFIPLWLVYIYICASLAVDLPTDVVIGSYSFFFSKYFIVLCSTSTVVQLNKASDDDNNNIIHNNSFLFSSSEVLRESPRPTSVGVF